MPEVPEVPEVPRCQLIGGLEHAEQMGCNLTRIETASNKCCHALAKQLAGTYISFDVALLICLDYGESACRIA